MKFNLNAYNTLRNSTTNVVLNATTGVGYPYAQTTFTEWITAECIKSMKKVLQPDEIPNPADISEAVLSTMKEFIEIHNATMKTTYKNTRDRLKPVNTLTASQIADFIGAFNTAKVIRFTDDGDEENDAEVGLYQYDGKNEGLYDTTETTLNRLVRAYDYNADSKKIEEVRRTLLDILPRVQRTANPNFAPVNNGIFDLEKKELLPFSPDYVFTTKLRVNYNPKAFNVVIHNPDDGTDWDVESWMNELSDDPAQVNLLWQVVGAIARPNVKFGKCAIFYSESGNNGKGTLCELMRNLCGKGAWASISINQMAGEFSLEGITRINAIITDENDVGVYLDKCANFKALTTWDGVTINRKFKKRITYQFHGFMVQCLNEMPRVQDKTDSFNRRLMVIPFTKCFTGAERKYIKDDYLNRTEVLEYVLYRVLHMNYKEFDIPASCNVALEEYKENNNPVLRFVHEVFPKLENDFIPLAFLTDLFRAWYEKESGQSSRMDAKRFTKEVREILKRDSEGEFWHANDGKEDKRGRIQYNIRATKKYSMDKPEPLIAEYDLRDWAYPLYTSSKDKEKWSRFNPDAQAKTYTGAILRLHPYPETTDETADETA